MRPAALLRVRGGSPACWHAACSLPMVMRLTSVRDLLTAIVVALLLAVGPALLVPDGARALEPLYSASVASIVPSSGIPSLLLGLGAMLALAFYGRPRQDP